MRIERLNEGLYASRPLVERVLRYLTVLNVMGALALLIYRYGFDVSELRGGLLLTSFDAIFTLFVVIYLTRVLYSFERVRFLRRTWLEALLVFFLLVGGLLRFLTGDRILEVLLWTFEVAKGDRAYRLILSVFVLTLGVLEITRATSALSRVRVKPATLLIASFLALVGVGTGLLMLPAMTRPPGGMPPLDALFTATSAACVTGLIVVDTATYFTLKGQLVILLLIQLGGIGIVTFATFFTTLLSQRMGLRQQSVIREHLSSETLFEAKGLLRRVISITLVIEALGFALIYLTWGAQAEFYSTRQRLFFSLFHSVSAFCNAGFSLYSNGLYQGLVREAYVLHVVVAGIIILGGLGFSTITDLFSRQALRERLKKPWKEWLIGTKMSVYTSLALIAVGLVLFLAFEWNNTLADKTLVPKVIAAFFQSVTTRTAGFNTVDIGALAPATLIMFMALMFIGASPGSTGGGIKTNTFLLIAISALATIRSRTTVEFDRRTIPTDLLFKAFSVFAFAIAYNFVGILLLTVAEPGKELLPLIFEQVSAFATVGISMGITSDLSALGKGVIIASMFLGRVGTITLALAVSSRMSSSTYRYPTGYVMVG
ncbi:MAG: potassium transporter TrkG [Catalinimonas sp.]